MAAVSPVAAELEPGAARICSEVKVKQTPGDNTRTLYSYSAFPFPVTNCAKNI